MIVVAHAFSRRNAGDSLLVDLTLRHLTSAGIGPDHITVLALDAPSFGDLPHVIAAPGEPWGRPSADAAIAVAEAAGAGLSRLSGFRIHLGTVARVLGRADGVVAVGGGYLRTRGVVNSAGTALNHLPQLLVAARGPAPAVYLPQSIGPLRGPVGAAARHTLRRVDAVHVRDDRSLRDLRGLGNVHRTPDLAVLALATRRTDPHPPGSGPPIVVARDLPRAGDYHTRLRALATALGEHRWAVQADGVGDRSDAAFYARLGVSAAGRLLPTLADAPAVVVSVRLHGALESILAGVPAVHLSYERKGWGAYGDLGLERFVHSARDFDPSVVARQVALLRHDPSDFWASLDARRASLTARSDALTEQLAVTFG